MTIQISDLIPSPSMHLWIVFCGWPWAIWCRNYGGVEDAQGRVWVEDIVWPKWIELSILMMFSRFLFNTLPHTHLPRKREDWWATKRNCFCPSEDDHPRRRKIRWPFVHWQSSWLKRRDDVSYHLSWRAVYVCVRGGCFSVPKFYSWIPILMVHSFYSPSTSTSLAD